MDTGGIRIEHWHALIGLPVVGISLLANFAALLLYLTRSLRTKPYFIGRWQGIVKNTTGEVHCEMIIYDENKELAGHVYYQGRNGKLDDVRGFDRLYSVSTDFECTVRRCRIGSGRHYRAIFRRAVHSFRLRGASANEIAEMERDYEYQFHVIRRFGAPRVMCSVTAVETVDPDVEFIGELSKVK